MSIKTEIEKTNGLITLAITKLARAPSIFWGEWQLSQTADGETITNTLKLDETGVAKFTVMAGEAVVAEFVGTWTIDKFIVTVTAEDLDDMVLEYTDDGIVEKLKSGDLHFTKKYII